VQNAHNFIQRLIGVHSSFLVGVLVHLLNVHARYLGCLLNLFHNFLSERVQVLLSVHHFLQTDHGGKITHNKHLVASTRQVHDDLVE